ncbi:WD40 repeat domain-containing protein [Phytohabitans sp. ZYX-F-186]|uniref:WD40 repeat domain-containing protein n=1 Tax=Phytohabitans maris TaxID=3071409 RepID=A0ABU0Z9F7_9ACTN|nr:WD40 repeat domain-containing protein [Phytohabitans sp. ZYX-F-186]MDQ7903673.1 WD40 repeat domain-containing protein [Phytohabitans sp. ZYX-F-186]
MTDGETAAEIDRGALLHLPRTLARSAQPQRLMSVLTDFAFLADKVAMVGPWAALLDLELPSAYRLDLDPDDAADLRQIGRALRLAEAVVARDRSQLAGQLVGRLAEVDSPRVARLVARARRWSDGQVWLCPRTQSLVSTVRTLAADDASISALCAYGDAGAVSVSGSGVVRIWDLRDGENTHTFSPQGAPVCAVAAVPGSSCCVLGLRDGGLVVWDIAAGRELRRVARAHDWEVRAVAAHSGADICVSAGSDGLVKVWSLSSLRPAAALAGHAGWVNDVAVTSEGDRAVTAGADTTVRVWDLRAATAVSVLAGHRSTVNAVAVAPRGDLAATASDDRTVRLWDLDRLAGVSVLTGHEDWVGCVAFSPDGRRLASGGGDHRVMLWHPATGQSSRLLGASGSWVNAVLLTAADDCLAGTDDGRIVVSDVTAEPAEVGRGHTDWIGGLVALPDGAQVLSAAHDGTIRRWDTRTGRPAGVVGEHDGKATSVAVDGGGDLAASVGSDGMVRLWRLADPSWRAGFRAHDGWINAIALTADGRFAVTAAEDATLRVWDVPRQRPVRVLVGHGSGVRGVAITPDGATLVSASVDGTVRCWDLHSGRERWVRADHGDWVNSIIVTADGRYAISSSDVAEAAMITWDLRTGELVGTWSGHRGWVHGISASRDGRLASSACGDGAVRLWDLPARRCLAAFTDEAPMTASVLTPDGRTLIAGNGRGRVHVLRVAGADHNGR